MDRPDMLVRPRAWVTASATSSGLRVSGALQPRHRDPLPQARQEARAGLKRGVGSGNHRLMRADSPDDDPIDKAQNEN